MPTTYFIGSTKSSKKAGAKRDEKHKHILQKIGCNLTIHPSDESHRIDEMFSRLDVPTSEYRALEFRKEEYIRELLKDAYSIFADATNYHKDMRSIYDYACKAGYPMLFVKTGEISAFTRNFLNADNSKSALITQESPTRVAAFYWNGEVKTFKELEDAFKEFFNNSLLEVPYSSIRKTAQANLEQVSGINKESRIEDFT